MLANQLLRQHAKGVDVAGRRSAQVRRGWRHVRGGAGLRRGPRHTEQPRLARDGAASSAWSIRTTARTGAGRRRPRQAMGRQADRRHRRCGHPRRGRRGAAHRIPGTTPRTWRLRSTGQGDGRRPRQAVRLGGPAPTRRDQSVGRHVPATIAGGATRVLTEPNCRRCGKPATRSACRSAMCSSCCCSPARGAPKWRVCGGPNSTRTSRSGAFRRRGPRTSCRTSCSCRRWRARSSPSVPRMVDADSRVHRHRRTPISGFSKIKDQLDERMETAEPWRTSRLAAHRRHGHGRAGRLPHVVEAVVNHISGHKGGSSTGPVRAGIRQEQTVADLGRGDRRSPTWPACAVRGAPTGRAAIRRPPRPGAR